MSIARVLAGLDNPAPGSAMDTEEAAGYIGCEPSTLRVWVSRRTVPHLKIGRLVRFRRRDLDRWLDKKLVQPKRI